MVSRWILCADGRQERDENVGIERQLVPTPPPCFGLEV